MSSEYYKAGPERAEKVQELFARIARRYDFLNDLQSFGAHRQWKRKTVDALDAHPGDLALDLCCGTGDLAQLLATRKIDVVALDFSFPMLNVARDRHPASTVHWLHADALRLPFPDSTFDVLTVGYGLRNLSDLDQGLREIHRVLKPGGRFAVLDFGKPENRVWRQLYFGYLATMVPIVGLLFAGSASAYSYILDSLKHFPGPKELSCEMELLGFCNLQIQTFATGAMALVSGERK